jgi:hypothetical protein
VGHPQIVLLKDSLGAASFPLGARTLHMLASPSWYQSLRTPSPSGGSEIHVYSRPSAPPAHKERAPSILVDPSRPWQGNVASLLQAASLLFIYKHSASGCYL